MKIHQRETINQQIQVMNVLEQRFKTLQKEYKNESKKYEMEQIQRLLSFYYILKNKFAKEFNSILMKSENF